MKSKIIFAVLITSAILFSACNSNDNVTPETTQENETITSVSEKESDDNKDTEAAVTKIENEKSESNITELTFNKSAQIEETVLYDENDVKITATGLVYTDSEVNLKLLIENNSNTGLSFISGSMGYSCNSVNGYMIDDGYMNCDVAEGKKANGVISFDYSELFIHGITEIADIEVGIEIEDDDDNRIYTGPMQVKTPLADTYEYDDLKFQNAITSDALINKLQYDILYFNPEKAYDDLGISIGSEFVIERNEKTLLLFEVTNNTDEDFYVKTSNIFVNGLKVESGTWSFDYVNPGKKCIVSIDVLRTVDEVCQTAFNIKEIGDISLDVGFVNDDVQDIASPTKLSIDIPDRDFPFDSTGEEVYNSNGLRIVSKGIFNDDSKYSDDNHIILLFENNSQNNMIIDDEFNSMSVNGFMTDYSFYSVKLKAGENAVSDIRLWGFGLEEIPVSNVSEITDVEFMISIKDDYGSIAEDEVISISNS